MPPFQSHWAKFVAQLTAFTNALLSELASCQRDTTSIIKDLPQWTAAAEPENLSSFRSARAKAAAVLLQNPALQWRQRQPGRRALLAIQNYEKCLDDLTVHLPSDLSVPGSELVAALRELAGERLQARAAGRPHRSGTLSLRGIVSAELADPRHPRIEQEGGFLALMAEGARLIQLAWEPARVELDSGSAAKLRSKAAETTHARIRHDSAAWITDQCNARIEALRSVPLASTRKMADRVLKVFLNGRLRRVPGGPDRINEIQTQWARQLRGIEDELQLEIALERCEDSILELVEDMLESLDAEYGTLVRDLESSLEWLRRELTEPSRGEFPEPSSKVMAASMRMAALEAGVRSSLETLPEWVQITPRLAALPRDFSPPRKIHIRESYTRAFQMGTRAEMLDMLRAAEAEHARILQAIEQAREVVAFGTEPSPDERAEAELAHEAIRNAISLLEYQRGEPLAWRESADRKSVRACAELFYESRLVQKRHRLGVFLYFAQQGLAGAAVEIARASARAAIRAAHRLLLLLDQGLFEFQVYIGWKPSPHLSTTKVTKRPVLPDDYVVDLAQKNLPPLYRRLFRFEPIQDPRFLIGREVELRAIAEARAFWEGGRPAAVVIVGQRGSGKTSLINCALKKPLAGLEVFRGEFNRRLVEEGQLRGFLAGFLKTDDAGRIEDCLLERRRVVILEELERTFLRQIGCFGAVRSLQRLIAATCPSTLWIFSINQVSFQFLSAAVQLGQVFSHRIDAGSAGTENLREAIMVRHNLSGLRLRFKPLPNDGKLAWGAVKKIRGREDPAQIFFDALEAESSGTYRAALDLWLAQIDTIQGGELSIKPLVRPQLGRLGADFDLEDLFTLVAILQHGGLTVEEHTIVFRRSESASRARLDGLLAREIIEPEPAKPGFRVRPQATRVVREALYRHNLL